MQEHFSREPPVYAKPKSSEAQPRPQSQPRRAETAGVDYSTRPPPPVPGATTSPPPLSQSAPIPPPKNDDRPPVPLKPGQHGASSLPPAILHPNTISDIGSQSPLVRGSVSSSSPGCCFDRTVSLIARILRVAMPACHCTDETSSAVTTTSTS